MSRNPGSQINLVGRSLGPYQVIEEIGRGGMGVVYRALDPTLGRQVALKVLPEMFSRDNAFIERFRREARTAAQLEHPRLVTIYQIGEDRAYHYIAMQFVQGRDLDRILREEGCMEVLKALEIARQTAQALSAAHEAGVIHRDIKPQNIMIDQDGRVKVMDFGIARLMEDTAMRLTQAGTMVGTPAYMSPEQGTGGVCDARSDVYSLGVVLFEMLTGDLPYKAATPITLFQKIISEPPTVPATASDLPPGLMDYVLYMIAKDPVERPADAGQVERDLSRMIGELRESELPTARQTVARNKPLWTPPPSIARTMITPMGGEKTGRRRLVIAALAAVLLLGGGAFAAYRALGGKGGRKDRRTEKTVAAAPVALSPTDTPRPTATETPESTPEAAVQPTEATATETATPVPDGPPKVTGVEMDRERVIAGARFTFTVTAETPSGGAVAKYHYKLDGQKNESSSADPVVMMSNLRAGGRTLTVVAEDAQGRRSEPFVVPFEVRRPPGEGSRPVGPVRREGGAGAASSAAQPARQTPAPEAPKEESKGVLGKYFKPTGKPGMLERIRRTRDPD